MTEPLAEDAASYARRHAGELDQRLSPAQRDLLGRVVARRIERGAKIETIARAVAHALPELGVDHAHTLGRDEALRALAWERLSGLRVRGEQQVALSPAADACPACRAAAGIYPIAGVPALPVTGCTRVGGCRCLYRAPNEMPAQPSAGAAAAPRGEPPSETGAAGRPWYRPRPPRPHGPRWTDEERSRSARPPRRPSTSSPPHTGGDPPKRPRR